MKKRAVWLIAFSVTCLPPLSASAASPTMVHGGGTGTFGADLDGDGNVDGSQFGMHVAILGNDGARGHFLCLMAGRSEILGLSLMSVEGPVTGGVLNADGSATFTGAGSVNLGNGEIFRGLSFRVTAWEGGPGVGRMQLSVLGAFDGVPGDTVIGNDAYDLPEETVASGLIAVDP
jgi:hypothetical protein